MGALPLGLSAKQSSHGSAQFLTPWLQKAYAGYGVKAHLILDAIEVGILDLMLISNFKLKDL